MHRHVRDHLEEVLAEPKSICGAISGVGSGATGKHLADCRECSDEVNAMRNQAALLRELRASQEEVEARPGFYARVLERIEAEGPASIWNLFFDSTFGQRLAIASLALAALLCVCLYSSERFGQSQEAADQPGPFVQELRGRVVAGEDQPGVLLAGAPDQDSVLVNLVTYREQ